MTKLFDTVTLFEKISSGDVFPVDKLPVHFNLSDFNPANVLSQTGQLNPLKLAGKNPAPFLFSTPPSDMEKAILQYMTFVVLPAWLIPALLDYIMHRQTDIKHTSGTLESVSHNLMMLEIGAPVLLILLAEVNPLVLVLLASAVVVHEGTLIWDGSLAAKRHRPVKQAEQHIHSFMEVMPFTAFSFFAIMHYPQLQKLLEGRAGTKNNWSLQWKKSRLSAQYLAAVMLGIGSFVILPYLEELLRCIKTSKKNSTGRESKEL